MESTNQKSNTYAAISWILALGVISAFVFLLTQNMKLETQLNLAQAKLAQKPAMPVTVMIRQSMVGLGLVAQFSNHSDRFIGLLVTFTNPTTNQAKKARLDIDANSMREVGHLEGWTFVSGDQILIEHHDYRASRITIQ